LLEGFEISPFSIRHHVGREHSIRDIVSRIRWVAATGSAMMVKQILNMLESLGNRELPATRPLVENA
jgi:hypothetical protein